MVVWKCIAVQHQLYYYDIVNLWLTVIYRYGMNVSRKQVRGCSSVAERPLRMRKVAGSIPVSSSLGFWYKVLFAMCTILRQSDPHNHAAYLETKKRVKYLSSLVVIFLVTLSWCHLTYCATCARKLWWHCPTWLHDLATVEQWIFDPSVHYSLLTMTVVIATATLNVTVILLTTQPHTTNTISS